MQDISTIILTFNEEVHIARCIENAKKYAKEIFIVDSFSSDNTVKIAQKEGVQVVQHAWINYSNQFGWALKNLPITTEWIWRQDADEYLSEELIKEFNERLPHTPEHISGYTAPCKRIFLNKCIKHGIVPLVLLRLFRYKNGTIEDKMMDEHISVNGDIANFVYPFYDDNHNNLTWWTNKHNGYATREAIDLLMMEYCMANNEVVNSGAHSMAIRRKKIKYTKLPLFWRAFAFFVYRYFFRFGFLDGKEGFLWHFLQGFWYRTLADAKVYEIKKKFDFDEDRIKSYLSEIILKR